MLLRAPSVSILVPAYRAGFLDLSIASALGQTYSDFELLISDDSAGDDVEIVARKWTDGRIRYMRNSTERRVGGNRDFLLSMASGRYIKFLFDDDFLFPEALERMVTAAEEHRAQLVFTAWHMVNEVGRILQSYGPSEEWNPPAELDPEAFFEYVVARTSNFLGGPTNILLDRAALESLEMPFCLDNVRMRFLSDVALFVNAVHGGHKLVGLDYFGSTFRQHGGQYSSAEGPAFSAGIFEWEFLQRWAADHGYLTIERGEDAIAWRHRLYAPHREAYPELALFTELGTRPDADGRFLTQEFLAVLGYAHQQVDHRLSVARAQPDEAR
jgi:glycosyltransferase involved in cell wall biosynthesis